LGTSDAEKSIFRALGRLLEHVPLQDISVGQIITEAQISRATFYFYFSSKFAVVSGLLVVVVDELSPVIAPALQPAPPEQREAALARRLKAVADVWAQNRAVLRAVVESWHAVPELRAVWIEMLERFTDRLAAEIVRERAARDAPQEPDARQLAALVLWATERVLYVAGLGVDDDIPSESEATELLFSLWASALYGSG
jgi:AcrR family transcriptional regulator